MLSSGNAYFPITWQRQKSLNKMHMPQFCNKQQMEQRITIGFCSRLVHFQTASETVALNLVPRNTNPQMLTHSFYITLLGSKLCSQLHCGDTLFLRKPSFQQILETFASGLFSRLQVSVLIACKYPDSSPKFETLLFFS